MDHLQKIKFKQTGDSRYINKNELNKACFQHDMAYGDFRDLTKRTAADKVLGNKAFNIAKDPKYDGYQRGLASMVYKFFNKKSSGSGIKSMQQNEQLAEELHKPIIRKSKKNSFKKWLQDNDIAIYSTHNEGKSVVAERFIRTRKNKIYKYMTSISKNGYIDKLHDIVNEYNNTYHRTIKIKSIDVKDNTYINIGKEVNDDPKFKVGDHVRISKYKNLFAKGYTPNWSDEIFVIKEIKNTVSWTYVINDLNGEEIIGTFYEKELQKIDQQEFRIEKVIKKKGNKLCQMERI